MKHTNFRPFTLYIIWCKGTVFMQSTEGTLALIIKKELRYN